MFQVVLMLLLATNYIPVVVNHLLMAFYSARVPFTCQVCLVLCVNYRVLFVLEDFTFCNALTRWLV